MKIKLYILLSLCAVLVLVLLKPWSRSEAPVKTRPVRAGNYKPVRHAKPYMEEDGVEKLTRALKTETNSNTLENLVIRLGETGDPAAVQPLLEALRTSPIPLVRINSAIALREIRDSAAIAPMTQALELEKDPHVKSWIASQLQALQEDREYGKLRFLDGKPASTIQYRPAPQQEKQVFTANAKGNMVHISTAYNLWQRIDKNGFVHMVTPFSRAVAVEDCGDFVFVLHARHCEVLCKAEQRWQVFTYSDGYPPQDYELAVENYKNDMVFTDKDDAELPVLHFDKTTRRFDTLPVEEYNQRQKQWERQEIDESKREWVLEKSTIMKREPGSGRETPLSLPYNTVREMVSSGGKLFVSSGASIRVFEQGKETHFLNAQNLLYSNKIKTMRADGPNLLVLYKDNIDIFDTSGEIKLLKRFAFPELNKDGLVSNPAIDFNTRYLFYAQGRQFIVEEPGTRKKLYEALFNVPVSGILQYQSLVLIQTSIGHSVFNPETGEMNNFYENKLQKKEPGEDEYEYYSLEPIGISKDYYIYIERLNLKPPRLAFFNLKTLKIEYSNALPITPLLTKFMAQPKETLLEKEFLVTMDNGDDPMDRQLRSFSIYPPGENRKPLLTASLSQDIAVPAGEPRGSFIGAFCPEGNNLWLATNFALYSFDLEKKQWQSHFTGRNLFYIQDLAVTEEGIYAFGSKSGSSPVTQWCRIDRETFQSESYSDQGTMAAMHSLRVQGDRLIYASKNGIGIYDPKSRIDKVLATPNPIDLAAVYGDKYLGVNQRFLYILEGNGKVLERLSLRELEDDPLDLQVLANEVRIVADNYLLRVNMETKEQIRVPLGMAYYPVKIVAGNESIPLIVFQRERIKGIRLEEKGGMIFDYQGPFSSSNRIRVVLEQGDTVYIGAEKGLYRLKKNNWELEEAWFKRGSIDALAASGDYYFLAAEDGIYQIDRATMEAFFAGAIEEKKEPGETVGDN